jgi:ankyrin repeat protein
MPRSQQLGVTIACLLAAISAAAADRCTVPLIDAEVPAAVVAAIVRPGSLGIPSPNVAVRTIVTRESRANGSGAAGLSPSSAGAGPSGKPAARPRPARPEPKDDQERLFRSIYDGDATGVQRLLRSPQVDVNAAQNGPASFRPIEVAAMRSDPTVVRALLEHGARVQGSARVIDIALWNLRSALDPSVPSVWTPTPTAQDYARTIELLLDAGADPDGASDPAHPQCALSSLLRIPHFEEDLRIAHALIAHGAHLGPTAPGGSPLAQAIVEGRADFVNLMLDQSNLDRATLDAALGPAFAAHDLALVDRLLAAGANPDATLGGRPVLCAAVNPAESTHALARRIIEKGAQPNVDCQGSSPITLAGEDRELILLLLSHGADPNRPNRYGTTVLDLAPDDDHALIDAILARGGQVGQSEEERMRLRQFRVDAPGEVVRALLHGQDYAAARLLARDGLGEDSACSAVLYSASLGAAGTLAELLRRGADPNSTTDLGSTALMVAASRGQDATLAVLLAQPKIEIDAATPRVFNPGYFSLYSEDAPPMWSGHRTALMFAARSGHAEIVRTLLEHGASPRRKDAEGRNALWYARTPETRNLLGP